VPEGGALTVWLQHESATAVDADGVAVLVEPVAVGGGSRLVIPIDQLPTTITVRTTQDRQLRQWSVVLVAAVVVPTLPEGGDCLSWVEEQLSEASPQQRGRLLQRRASCLKTKDIDGKIASLEQAIEAHVAIGEEHEAARAQIVLSFVLLQRSGALPEALALLEGVQTDNGELRWGLNYHWAIFSQAIGDYRQALRRLDEADELIQQLDLPTLAPTQNQTASVYADLGRFDEAEALQHQLVDDLTPGESCAGAESKSKRLDAMGWYLLRRAEAQEQTGEDPTMYLERARAIQERCELPELSRANTLVNLALAAWHRGDFPAVTAALDAVDALQPSSDLLYALWYSDLRSRVSRATGETEGALAATAQLVALARLSSTPDSLSQAHDARAELLSSIGRISEAIEASEEAHQALLAGISQIPLGGGRESFLAARERITERYVALLLEEDRPEEAMAVVRRTRSRVLRAAQISHRITALSPDERREWEHAMVAYAGIRKQQQDMMSESWQLSLAALDAQESQRQALADAASLALDRVLSVLEESTAATLRAPDPGEVMLTWFSVEGAWVGFSSTTDGTQAVTIGALPPDPDSRGAALLGPFVDRIVGAERITLLPWGALRSDDLHTLPVGGMALQEHAPVAYSLDLSGQRRATDAAGSGLLVVADPGGTLSHAREEGEQIPAASARLLGGQASRAAVLAALPDADRFHYAGHAEYRHDDALGARMSLADGDLLIGDILALSRAPRQVVLSACEGSRSPPGPVETWGLAQAFLIAGADEVLAASRPVDDAAGAALARALYAADPGLSLTQRLPAAIRAVGSKHDLAAWRVWVR
jgi:tetratricopeptide (TPR) repeat protein